MYGLKILIAILLIPFTSFGQEILNVESSRFVTRFPFKLYSGGVMVLRAKYENIPDSLNFILDTGSGGISLDSSTCEEFNIATTATDTTITGIGGNKKVHFVFDKQLKLPGLTLRHLNFHINNYEVLTSVYGEKIDGILGYSFFSRYVVEIDFDSLYISVYSPGKISYPPGGYTLRPLFTSLPIQYLQIRDAKKINSNFYFDTGAGLCFLMSEQYVKDSAVLLKKRKPLMTQAEGMGGRVQMRLTVVKEVKIGPYKFRKVPTYLYKDDYNVTSYPFTGGLIGNELLRRFNMVINYGQREIHLLPNSHFNEPFDYAYTGLGIYVMEGKITVVDVIADSPAAIAGIVIGDELVAVGNNVSNNIQQYKNILQNTNTRVRLIIKRNGKLYSLLIKPDSIL
ncbi:MAG: aspartyl protease family protein [Ferruginibacter sp.]